MVLGQTMMGSRTTNPLYDSNEALNQLDLLAQPDAMAMSVSPMAAAAPQVGVRPAVRPPASGAHHHLDWCCHLLPTFYAASLRLCVLRLDTAN